jgi:hypothetical protein
MTTNQQTAPDQIEIARQNQAELDLLSEINNDWFRTTDDAWEEQIDAAEYAAGEHTDWDDLAEQAAG